MNLFWRHTQVCCLAGALVCCLTFTFTVRSSTKAASQQQTTPASEREQLLDAVRKRIAGRESEPAETVFHNIEILRGKPASRLPGMMGALTGLLGVQCSHCHNLEKWESDEKPAKRMARKHFAMQAAMNEQYFTEGERITCWTCHRGQAKPENLPKKSS